MEFSREIQRLFLALILAFIVTALASAYWAITGREEILLREDNPRAVEAEAAIRRGAIYDRDGELLVESLVMENESLKRSYLYPAMNSAIGYFSFRYGVAGAEAAYDAILRGDNQADELNQFVQQEVLHRPQVGSAIRLSFDLSLQARLAEVMDGQRGAIVVLSVPDGAVLSLMSLPTYDPNSLDTDWDSLVQAEGKPFFNRVLQGQYQAGGMLQTALMSAGILTQQAFDTVLPEASAPVRLDELEITCALEPPQADLTYTEAYAYACPRPFILLADQINPTVLNDIIGTLGLDTPPTLTGFLVDIETTPTAEATPLIEAETSFLADVLGQGDLTINPLGMAYLTAAILNEGNAPQPYALLAVQNSDGTWAEMPHNGVPTPLMTDSTARRLRDLMIANTQMGASANAYYEGLSIGSHAALAYSGEETQAWFIGFVVQEGNQGAAVALVLENSADVQLAATIGGLALRNAYANLLMEQARE